MILAIILRYQSLKVLQKKDLDYLKQKKLQMKLQVLHHQVSVLKNLQREDLNYLKKASEKLQYCIIKCQFTKIFKKKILDYLKLQKLPKINMI